MRTPLPVLLTLCLAVLWIAPARGQNVSVLADLPDYRRLDAYQETITREEFAHLLDTLYAPHGGWQAFIRVDPDAAVIRKTSIPLDDLYTLRFAPTTRPGNRCRPATGSRAPRWLQPLRQRTSRWPECGSRSTRGTSADGGRSWKRAGSRSATRRRSWKVK